MLLKKVQWLYTFYLLCYSTSLLCVDSLHKAVLAPDTPPFKFKDAERKGGEALSASEGGI